METVVKMEWNEVQQKWLMKTPNGAFLYDLWDCANISRLFDNELDKNIPKWFQISIKQRGQ